jgi:aryl-alcohol dehydrogenase-like predicted oxidoreductase
VRELEIALDIVPVASVQNRYNLSDRSSEAVLQACEREGVGFIPWYPLATGRLARPGGPREEVARRHDATPSQVALAWLLGTRLRCCLSRATRRSRTLRRTWRQPSWAHRRGDGDAGEKLTGDEPWTLG